MIMLMTLLAVLRYFNKPVNGARPFIAVVTGVLVFAILIGINQLLVYGSVLSARQPIIQSIIPAVAITLIGTYTPRPHRAARVIAWSIFGIALALIGHFVWLTETPCYTENPQFVSAHLKYSQRSTLDHIDDALEYVADYYPRKSFSPGWIEQASFYPRLTQGLTACACPPPSIRHHDAIFTRYWHTGFTGLYGTQVIPNAVWYPGGRVKDAIGKLEYRPQ